MSICFSPLLPPIFPFSERKKWVGRWHDPPTLISWFWDNGAQRGGIGVPESFWLLESKYFCHTCKVSFNLKLLYYSMIKKTFVINLCNTAKSRGAFVKES
jgi:hypothetical protein